MAREDGEQLAELSLPTGQERSISNADAGRLTRLQVGQPIVFGGDRVTYVGEQLAAAFRPGDRLVVVGTTGDLLHVPAAEYAAATTAVDAAVSAFAGLGRCTDDQLTAFFDAFAPRLADESVFANVVAANAADVQRAEAAGRSTTRLRLTAAMRAGMVAGLHTWRDSPLRREDVVARIGHVGWAVEARRAPLGVVGFVFEGRPNVVADATGVLRTGNAVVMRIGSDVLGTAEAVVTAALEPAREEAGLPEGVVGLVRSPARAAGWALFDDRRLVLAVARGSGAGVAQLGAVARQAGTPVSLHGTGGAWLVAGESAATERFRAAVVNSLDRKVCNTLNVCCIPRTRADLVEPFLAAVDEAAARLGANARLHVLAGSRSFVSKERFERRVAIRRADGVVEEPAATTIDEAELAAEWEWEGSPEVTLAVTDDVPAAVALCNRWSPRFIASLVADDPAEHAAFYAAVDAPFVGDGFTRWVDGQYALDTPELGLSNWHGGRLLARGGVLAGDSLYTVRHRATIIDPDIRR